MLLFGSGVPDDEEDVNEDEDDAPEPPVQRTRCGSPSAPVGSASVAPESFVPT